MSNWIWPVLASDKITSGVGPRWGTQHKGIDIAAPKGKSIVASRKGVVTKINKSCTHNYGKNKSCGCGGGYGNYVYIDHKDGYITRYAHMTDVYVTEGQVIDEGATIGTVGSTGYSTGDHLHFEIRYKDIVKDPEEYVNSKNKIIPPIAIEKNIDTIGGITYESGDPVAVNSVVTRDFLEKGSFHAYVKFYIGDKEINYESGKPSIVQSFSINRLEEAGSKANFVLFDDEWDSLEPLLAENWDNISIEYGYSGSDIISPRYLMILQDYTIDFVETGTLLSISAISEGVYQNLEKINFDTGTMNPSDAIERICRQMGWDIDEEEWADTLTVDREDDYKVLNMNPVTYIMRYIIPEAITPEGEIVSFSVESGVARLRTESYNMSKATRNEESIPTYVYRRGYDGVVESLSFNMKGVFGGTTKFETVTRLRGNSFDINTKEEISSEKDLDNATTVTAGNYSSTLKDQSTADFITAGETTSQLEAKLNYHIKNGMLHAYEATMTILGDPRIQILQDVRIINITDYGSLHHTSGIYLVKGILDSVEDGNFKTTLQLIRESDISNGIVLRSSKSTKK